MAKNKVAEGKTIDYVNAGSAISSGDVVVVGNLLGVALVDIANGETGAVAICGVYELPKASAAVIAQGETINWDVSAGNVDDNLATPATGDLSGGCVAVDAAAATTTVVNVALNVGTNTVT